MEEYDYTRRAIDVMTAWATDAPDSTGFSQERMAEYVGESHEGEMQLMFGLVNLAGYLLLRLEHETAKPIQWHLQDIARTIISK
ncbi:hypothetical protein EI067_22900 [Mycobacterium paragordonae]|uniref:hypothetical protein n=1 Tax=Mycobacterium paragordonae TaxID=1389713 RepID=UPI00105D235B|nr:hypothetical protein [Mycobacterium paragordonae]TDK91552.1 hypothetical protein EI067_22900 [Mycobacterium paragordonae]